MYTGTFDGNGKSVYGLTAALFGYTGEGALVKNVTVYGSNHAADDKDTARRAVSAIRPMARLRAASAI